SVYGERTIGSGSVAEQFNRARGLLELGNSIGSDGSHEAVEVMVQALAGPRNVRRFIKPFDRINEPGSHNWEANQESLAILGGQNIMPPYGNQRDEIHVAQHLKDFEPSVSRILSGEVQG